jgi:hypothetical protein
MDGPGVRFLIRSALRQATLCGKEEDCPDRVFRCRQCGYSQSEPMDECPACGAGWKQLDVSHGPDCPKRVVEDAMDSANGALVRRCFRLLNAKAMGLSITLADISEEEFRTMELIEALRQEEIRAADGNAPRSR